MRKQQKRGICITPQGDIHIIIHDNDSIQAELGGQFEYIPEIPRTTYDKMLPYLVHCNRGGYEQYDKMLPFLTHCNRDDEQLPLNLVASFICEGLGYDMTSNRRIYGPIVITKKVGQRNIVDAEIDAFVKATELLNTIIIDDIDDDPLANMHEELVEAIRVKNQNNPKVIKTVTPKKRTASIITKKQPNTKKQKIAQ